MKSVVSMERKMYWLYYLSTTVYDSKIDWCEDFCLHPHLSRCPLTLVHKDVFLHPHFSEALGDIDRSRYEVFVTSSVLEYKCHLCDLCVSVLPSNYVPNSLYMMEMGICFMSSVIVLISVNVSIRSRLRSYSGCGNGRYWIWYI